MGSPLTEEEADRAARDALERCGHDLADIDASGMPDGPREAVHCAEHLLSVSKDATEMPVAVAVLLLLDWPYPPDRVYSIATTARDGRVLVCDTCLALHEAGLY